MLPYLALALYIISLIASLILMLTAKSRQAVQHKYGLRWFKAAVFIHLFLLLLFLIGRIYITGQTHSSSFLSFSFLFYFCTGTALCGWAMRTKMAIYIKIYFALFDASLLLFLLMPFNFSIFLLSGNFNETSEGKFTVNDHYYITEQGSVMKQTEYPIYRVVKHNGMFNQTVQYNVNVGGVLDSIHVLSIVNDKSAVIRAYIRKVGNYYSIDSTDVDIKLKRESKDEIQRQL